MRRRLSSARKRRVMFALAAPIVAGCAQRSTERDRDAARGRGPPRLGPVLTALHTHDAASWDAMIAPQVRAFLDDEGSR